MYLFRHEFMDVVSRPTVWIGALLFCIFLLYSVGHLELEEDQVVVAIYQTPADTPEMTQWFRPAYGLLREMANVQIREPVMATIDIASQMLKDKAAIAITQTPDGWRFTLRSRSAFEHRQLVRVAQALGASLSKQKPWGLLVKELLVIPEESEYGTQGWPIKIQIAGITADPGRQARLFVPKVIALLANLVAFAFASRSMIRDISNNVLPLILVAIRGRWIFLIMAKLTAAVMIGLLVLWSLIVFTALTQTFEIKNGFTVSTMVQVIGLVISAMLGIAFSLLARTESRIYLIGSAYLILLVLLSGLIAKIDPREKLLAWLSDAIPLGYAMDVLSDWMFFGIVPVLSDAPAQTIFALLILSGLFVYGSVLSFRENL
jgi:hypothetical protein